MRTSRTADRAELEVSDSGIGLAPGDAERVFERFFRSPRVVDSQIPGTGLGLFIAKAIAEAHGGRISASNREERRHDVPDRAAGAPRGGPTAFPDGQLVV